MKKGDSPSLDDLDARLKEARARKARPGEAGEGKAIAHRTGLGLAFRIGTELVSALVVGVGIGWLLDRWLGTAPWFLVVFLFLGAGAGIMNVYRTVNRLGLAVGYRNQEAGEERPADEEEED
jgi:ATP synthase protein I